MSTIRNVLVLGISGVGKKNWIRSLLGQNFEPRYFPLENITQHSLDYNNTRFNLHVVPGQMPYLTGKYINTTQFDSVLIFVDVTSNISNRKALTWRHSIQELGFPVLLIYTKSDIQYGSKLESMIQDVQHSTYCVISSKNNVNVHDPLNRLM